MQSSKWDSSGGAKSVGRLMLLSILNKEKVTQGDIAARVGCSSAFISLVSSGKKRPQRWSLRCKIERELLIPQESWDQAPNDNDIQFAACAAAPERRWT